MISKVSQGMLEVQKILDHMRNFVEPLKKLTRKEAAKIIQGAYGTTNRCGYAFHMLDGRETTDDAIKKLLFQVIG